MPLKSLRLIVVGRLRIPFWKAAAEYYYKRISCWRAIYETIIKDGNPSLSVSQRTAMEGKSIVASLDPRDIPICLDEKGKSISSQEFAKLLEKFFDNTGGRPCFIIGGAFGLDRSVHKVARDSLALGCMTLPHELARVVFLEQLYRAETLIHNIPYHH